MSFDLVGSWFEVSEANAAGDPNRLHHAVSMRSFCADVFGPGVAGVTSAAALTVSERGAGANMSVDIAVGGCVVASTRSVHQGSYHGYNSAVTNVAVAASDPTNARIDRILARVKDPAQDAAFEGIEGMEFYVEEGTPAAVPGLPPVTVEDWIEIARVTVGASVTSITDAVISDLRTVVTAGQGTQLIESQFGSATNTVTFLDIPQDYRHLEVVWLGNHDTAGGGRVNLHLQNSVGAEIGVNNIASLLVQLNADGTRTDQYTAAAAAQYRAGHLGNARRSTGRLLIPNYSSTVPKSFTATGWSYGTSAASASKWEAGGSTPGTETVHRVHLVTSGGNWANYQIDLYGIH